MTRDYQIINNEMPNPKYDILSFIWKCDPIDNGLFQHTHRNITINNFGNPVLKLYPNEIKHLYKQLYNGTFKVPQDAPASSTDVLEVFSKEGNKVFEFNNATKTISTVGCKPGTGILKSIIVNNYVDMSQFNDIDIEDKDLIVIVEEAPILTNVEWGFENPLYVEPNSNTKIEFTLTYDNGDIRTYVDNSFINCLHITNRCYGDIENGEFKCNNQKGVTYATFTGNDSFGIANLPDTLKIIICNNKEFAPTIDSQFEWNMHQTIDLDDDNNRLIIEELIVGTEPLVKHDRFNYITLNAYNDDIITLDRNRIITNKLGSTVVTFNSTFIDFDYYMDLFNLDLQWSIRVVKSVDRVEWSINRHELNVGEEAQITVNLIYNDGSIEDISRNCSYNYDHRFIEIKDNDSDPSTSGDIIKAIAPGTTSISLVSESIPEGIEIPAPIMLTIIQPITKMTITPYELEMIIGEEENLKLKYEPPNATPVPLAWLSTEPGIVSVDDKGHIKALSRGSSDILIMIDREDNADAIDPANPDAESAYKNKNIYLPTDLHLSCKFDDKGVGEIIYGEAVLYTITLNNFEKLNLTDVYAVFTNLKEQQIKLILNNATLKYGETITGSVVNSFNKKVKGLTIATVVNDNDSISTTTNVNGQFILTPLNTVRTDSEGVAKIDGIKVKVVKDNISQMGNDEPIDAIINHYATKEIRITINQLTLSAADNYNLIVSLITDDEVEYSKPIIDTHVNIYVAGELIFSDYPIAEESEDEDLRGMIIIESLPTDIVLNTSPTDNSNYEGESDIDEPANLIVYDPTRCAVCSVRSKAIEVEKVEFDVPSVIVDTEVEETYVHVKVTPENATYPEVTVTVENERLAVVREYDTNEYWVDAIRVGDTVIRAVSNDNPDITAECALTVTSSKVQEVKITTAGNDNKYEFYDSLNEKVVVNLDKEEGKPADPDDPIESDQFRTAVVGERVTEEKYDDDDFERFYVPVNNSLQLEAAIYPEDAADKTIKWLSSDSSLVKVNDKGIVTAIRQGKQDLDVYGDDDISQTAFANTVWVTAMNPKYNKYDLCQVRVTRNKIVAINVDKPDEHDTDVDDIVMGTPWTGGGETYGNYKPTSEHEQDYIIHVGETIEIPVSVDVQDSNFGTSDYVKWNVTKNKMWNVIELGRGSPDHSNAWDDEYNFNKTTLPQLITNKNNFTLKVTGVNIGDATIYAQPYDNVSTVDTNKLYVQKELQTVTTDKNGDAVFKSNIEPTETGTTDEQGKIEIGPYRLSVIYSAGSIAGLNVEYRRADTIVGRVRTGVDNISIELPEGSKLDKNNRMRVNVECDSEDRSLGDLVITAYEHVPDDLIKSENIANSLITLTDSKNPTSPAMLSKGYALLPPMYENKIDDSMMLFDRFVTAHVQWYSSKDNTIRKHYKQALDYNRGTSGQLMERYDLTIKTASGKIIRPKVTANYSGIVHHYRELKDGTFEEGIYISLQGAQVYAKEEGSDEYKDITPLDTTGNLRADLAFSYEDRLNIYVQVNTESRKDILHMPVYVIMPRTQEEMKQYGTPMSDNYKLLKQFGGDQTTLTDAQVNNPVNSNATLAAIDWINAYIDNFDEFKEGINYHKTWVINENATNYAIVPSPFRDYTHGEGKATVGGFHVYLTKQTQNMENGDVTKENINNAFVEWHTTSDGRGAMWIWLPEGYEIIDVNSQEYKNSINAILNSQFSMIRASSDNIAVTNSSEYKKLVAAGSTAKAVAEYKVDIYNWLNEKDVGQHIYIWDQNGKEMYIDPIVAEKTQARDTELQNRLTFSNDTNKDIEGKTQQVADLRNEITFLTNEATNIGKEIEGLDEKLRAIENSVADINNNKEANITKYNTNISNLNTEIAGLEQQIADKEVELADYNSKLDWDNASKVQNEIIELENKIKNCRIQINVNNESIAKIDADIRDLDAEWTEIYATKVSKQADKTRAETENPALITTKQSELNDLEKALKDLRNSLADADVEQEYADALDEILGPNPVRADTGVHVTEIYPPITLTEFVLYKLSRAYYTATPGMFDYDPDVVHLNIENAKTIYTDYEIEQYVKDLFDFDYLKTTGIPVVGAKVSKTEGGEFIVRLPNEFQSTFVSKIRAITDNIIPYLSKDRSDIADTETDDDTTTEGTNEIALPEEYAVVSVNGNPNTNVSRVVLSGPTKGQSRLITKTWAAEYDKDVKYNNLYFPAEKTDSDQAVLYGNDNPLDATPGRGMYTTEEIKSREVKIRVVASPKKFRIGWCNPWNDQLYAINEIYDGIYRDRWSSRKHHFLAIGWDDDFQELLDENDALNLRELDEKYKSFAWFSDNEEVVRFIDCPMGITWENREDYYDDADSVTKKGTDEFKVKGSWIKEIICEGRGRANIYILNTKGQVMRRIPVRIK